MRVYETRTQAGQDLAKALAEFKARPNTLVLALPRGGVPVAYEVAKALGLPLDVFIVRKLGVPGHAELAMGAVSSSGVQLLNAAIVRDLGITDEEIEAVARAEEQEITRRAELYRARMPALVASGKTVLVVDDGIATGATMRVAVQSLKKLGASHVVVAVPVAPIETISSLRLLADQVVCRQSPADFAAVGEWYADFHQVTDREVQDLMAQASGGHSLW